MICKSCGSKNEQREITLKNADALAKALNITIQIGKTE
jgi:hypothetical protein